MDTYCLVCKCTQFYVFPFEDGHGAVCYKCEQPYKIDVDYGEVEMPTQSYVDRMMALDITLDDSMVRTLKILLHPKTLIHMAKNVR